MTETDNRLADEVMDHRTNFAKYVNPNRPGSESWLPFTIANPFVMTLNIKQCDRRIKSSWNQENK